MSDVVVEKDRSAAEIVRDLMAQRVRDNSRDLVKLTPVDSLLELDPQMKLEEIETGLVAMGTDEQFKDIRRIAASNGAIYLYSDSFITQSYARILARAEGGNPLATIASTVRDDSRTYPRPTNVDLFHESVFGIEASELDEYVGQVLKTEKYRDIKLIEAETGARYLFSTLYLNEDWARALVHYEEVERKQNP